MTRRVVEDHNATHQKAYTKRQQLLSCCLAPVRDCMSVRDGGLSPSQLVEAVPVKGLLLHRSSHAPDLN